MRILLLILMFLPSLALAKEVEMKVYDYKLTRVLDGDTEICVPTEATSRHTEIQRFLAEQKLKVGRCAFLKTPIGEITGKHIDEGKYYSTKDRYHLSITGTYRYSVWDDGNLEFTKEEVIIEPGTFFWFNNKNNHMAENIGNCERIAFIFDVPMSPNNP